MYCLQVIHVMNMAWPHTIDNTWEAYISADRTGLLRSGEHVRLIYVRFALFIELFNDGLQCHDIILCYTVISKS